MKKELISIACGIMLISAALPNIVAAEVLQPISGDIQGSIVQNVLSNVVLSLKQPLGVAAVPGSNDLIIVQSASGTISKWSNGTLQTIAGKGNTGYSDGQ